MSYGVPGYDFQPTEIVNAEHLLQWIRSAQWMDLSYSETAGDLYGLSIGETAPGASEGRLWYKPSIKKLSVYTQYGWTGIFLPHGWETRRFISSPLHDNPRFGMPRAFYQGGYDNPTPSVTLGTAALMEYNQGYRVHVVSMFTNETSSTGTHLLATGRGYCPAYRPLGAIGPGNFCGVLGAAPGQLSWLASDSTEGSFPLGVLGTVCQVTLTNPGASLITMIYFWGGFVDAVKEPF